MDLEILEGVSRQSTVDTDTTQEPVNSSTPAKTEENFFQKHQTKIVVGVGILAVCVIAYAAYSTSETNEEVNGTLSGVKGKFKTHKKKIRRSK
jgi:hypothetical protein